MDESEINKRFAEIERRLDLIENQNNSSPDCVQKNKSIKEFLIEKVPSKDFHKTLVIGYYLENHEGMKSFNAKDLEEGYRKAKEIVPNNLNYNVIQSIKNGYMMEDKEKKDKFKSWILTNTGEKFVEQGLVKNGKS